MGDGAELLLPLTLILGGFLGESAERPLVSRWYQGDEEKSGKEEAGASQIFMVTTEWSVLPTALPCR